MRRLSMRCLSLFLSATCGLAFSCGRASAGDAVSVASNGDSCKKVAAEADRQIMAELQNGGVSIADLCSDEDFLRRASLDITGQLPSPTQVSAFRADADVDKRAKLIDQLIASPEFGLNWGRYWRDVIYIRATEQRSRFNQEEFTVWMADQWNKSVGWNSTVSAMLTASGNVQEHPETALIFAQGALAEEVAAEACRVFLGIQLQCANCHDHPSDVWKREQFHQLAAYFPRMSERRVMQGMPVFEIVSVNADERRGDFMQEHPDLFVRSFDRDSDNKLSRDELKAGPKRRGGGASLRAAMKKGGPKSEEMKSDEMQAEGMKADSMAPPNRLPEKAIDRMFDFGDTNKDGLLTVEEIKSLRMPQNKKRGAAEHRMVNLKNPDSAGEIVDPRFFVDGSTLPRGKTDEERRQAVAAAFTSPENPWFARAIVNRVWAEMLGEGFYMPVDDLGPNRTARYPEVLDLICQNFVASGYDPKWLVRTIANTAAYQRKIRPKSPSEDALPFASATPVPLRADVIFNSLVQVFGLTEGEMNGRSAAGAAKAMKDNPRAALQGPRFQFDLLFGIDPSVPKDDVIGTIPQSLMMMNSRNFRARMSARGNTPVVKILAEHKNNADALQALYLLVLAREPSTEEVRICSDYIAEVKDRPEAFEDMMWSLVNSSEFISRR